MEESAFGMEMERNRVGNLLAGARHRAGLTQAQLAKKLRIRQNMVSDYERGRRSLSGGMAKRFSATLAIKEEHLKPAHGNRGQRTSPSAIGPLPASPSCGVSLTKAQRVETSDACYTLICRPPTLETATPMQRREH